MAFEMDAFVSKCIAEFGTAASFALRSGHAPKSELGARLCGEYAVSFVDGEFDFTVAEMVSGAFPSCDRAYASSRTLQNALCTPLAADDMLDMCVVEIEVRLTRLVVGAVIAATLSRRKNEQSTLSVLPDALLARIANLAMDDVRRARSNYVSRRNLVQNELAAFAKQQRP